MVTFEGFRKVLPGLNPVNGKAGVRQVMLNSLAQHRVIFNQYQSHVTLLWAKFEFVIFISNFANQLHLK